MLSQQDAMGPMFRVRHVPLKEDYLCSTSTGQAGTTMTMRHAEYGKAQRCAKHHGIWLLGSEVLTKAAGMGLRRRVPAAVAEGATTAI